MLERNESSLLDGFSEYLRNKGLKETSVKDDLSRIRMMEKRDIDYTMGEEYASEPLFKSDLSNSTITSCLRVCKYYKDYLDKRNDNI